MPGHPHAIPVHCTLPQPFHSCREKRVALDTDTRQTGEEKRKKKKKKKNKRRKKKQEKKKKTGEENKQEKE